MIAAQISSVRRYISASPGRRKLAQSGVETGSVHRVELVATCLWRIQPAVLLALDERLGLPVDSYVNGSQTWLTDVEAAGVTLEWRLHPVAGYRPPEGCSHYDVWELVVASLTADTDDTARDDVPGPPDTITIGDSSRPLDSFWDGLECFVAHGDDVEPATLSRLATDLLDIPPDAAGLVDHRRIGDEWERQRGTVSIVAMLFGQLAEVPRSG